MDFIPERNAAILIAATAVTRIACRSHYLNDIDSVNYALAIQRFDPTVHQPHPPGYFLYVCLARLAGLLFHDANTALVAISVVFSCAAVAVIYGLAGEWFGWRSALFAGALFVFSPLAWFHGTVALTYIVEAFFSALTGYLCWKVSSGNSAYIVPAAIVLGAAAGFRPSSLLLAPLFAYSLRRATRRNIGAGMGSLACALLLWLIPMFAMTDASSYFSSLAFLWRSVPSQGTVFNSSLANSFARLITIGGIFVLCFGCTALLPLVALRGHFTADHAKTIFTVVWITPGLLFFTFVYLKFVNSGYLLLLLPPACLWMGVWATFGLERISLARTPRWLLVASFAAINTAIYLAAPVYCSWFQMRRTEAELASIQAALPQVAPPQDSMIVGFDSHFLGYRQAGYYLPAYTTVQFPEVQLAAGRRVFTMFHQDTLLQSGVTPEIGVKNFVLFPLPSGDREYSDFLDKVRKRFPPGDLRSVVRGGHEFIIGPVGELRYLFPAAIP